MRWTPRYLMTDTAEVKRLVRRHPWATFVSWTANGLVASHYPALVDETADGLVLLTHFGRPDEVAHEAGEREMLVIVQGPHDYVSSSWYETGDLAPTWNHVTAHLYGVPKVLSGEETYALLSDLTDRFERDRPGGRSLAEDEAYARRIAKGAVGLRIPVTRFDARAKLSQNKAPEVRERITSHLDTGNPALAAEMRRTQEDT
ncbi:MAG: FMN-binding negative transcriptional regulator [Aeromicrobium sp.]|uniref:FMN-binding negative transcriptional regulator n=1 Tax=Aeromicrobium sp. TaxID=1871063 RepID=UPI0039E29B81